MHLYNTVTLIVIYVQALKGGGFLSELKLEKDFRLTCFSLGAEPREQCRIAILQGPCFQEVVVPTSAPFRSTFSFSRTQQKPEKGPTSSAGFSVGDCISLLLFLAPVISHH